MPILIGAAEASIQKVVLEVRYPQGFLYLDRCGSMLNSMSDEWMSADQANPQGAQLINLVTGTALTISALKYDLSLTQRLGGPPIAEDLVAEIGAQGGAMHALVSEILELREFSRIGFRVWTQVGCDSVDEARTWLASLRLVEFSPRLMDGFGGGAIKESVMSVILQGDDRDYRITFGPSENESDLGLDVNSQMKVVPSRLPSRQREAMLAAERARAQRRKRQREHPLFAAKIDVDASQENPKIVDPMDFVTTSYAAMKSGLERLGS